MTHRANRISTPQQFSVLMDELASSTWTLAAVGLLFDSGIADQLGEPTTLDELEARCPGLSRERIARCLAVCAVRGLVDMDGPRFSLAPGVVLHLEPPLRSALQGDYRSNLLQAAAYLRAATGPEVSSGWRHTDPMILQAQGDGSSMFATGLKMKLAAEMGDLAERLERPGAAFLDIGAGVGSLSIAMCREFPQLRVVGLDQSDAPLALARANVARTSFGDRIDFRQMAVQDLGDEGAFDLAWLPAFFLGSREAIPPALARIRAALRPGGWVLLPAVRATAGEAVRTVWSLVMESWGGPVLSPDECEGLLLEAGFAPQSFAGPSWVAMIAGRR
jgi:protein-L-isoaspartate O-methyltransferase